MSVLRSLIREILQRLGVAGLGEKVIQARREAFAELCVLGGQILGDPLQGGEVRRPIAVPEGMVGDEVEAVLEKVAQV